MTLYHGSTIAVREPKIMRSDIGRDFGPAFYTTDIREQAERWAVRRMRFAQKAGEKDARAIVSVYSFDERRARTTLKCRDFEDVSLAWLDVVVRCRSSLAYRHGFDLMSGKIANDSVGETVSYVVAGVMPRELALERLRFQQINSQVAFCSDASLGCLSFVRAYEVGAST